MEETASHQKLAGRFLSAMSPGKIWLQLVNGHYAHMHALTILAAIFNLQLG